MNSAGRRVVGVDDRRPSARRAVRLRAGSRPRPRAARTATAWRRGRPPTCRGARGARGSGWSGSRRRRRSRRPARGPGRATSSRRPRPGRRPRPSPGARAWRLGASGVVACSALAAPDAADPGRGRADHARSASPAASSAATARNEVVVLPSVPVMPTTAELAARVAVPPGRGASASAAGVAVDDELGQRRRPGRALDDRGRGAPAAAAARRSRGRRRARPGPPRTATPGRTARESWVTPRTATPASAGRADRPAVAPRAAQAARRPRAARSAPPSGRGSVGSAAASRSAIGRSVIARTDPASRGRPAGPSA